MRRLAAIAAMVAALISPATAQHAAAHGGSSGHSVSAPHGSFSSNSGGPHIGGFAPSRGSYTRFGSYGGGSAGRPGGFAPRRFGPSSGYRSFYPGYRPPYRPDYRGAGPDRWHDRDWDGHHRHHGVTYGYGFVGYPYAPYGYPIFTGYVDPWLFGPDTYDEDTYGYSAPPASANAPSPYPDYGELGYAPQSYGPEYSAPRPNQAPVEAPSPTEQPSAHRPAYSPSGSSASAVSEQAVTLIFKDGRPPETIHNYLLTPTKLTVLDARYREISLEQINIAATQAANRAAGIDFRVPPSR